MKSYLKIELKKAFTSRMFLITLLIGLAIAAVSVWQTVADYFWWIEVEARAAAASDTVYAPSHVSSLYREWMGQDNSHAFPALFYMLLPLLAGLAYGWSYFEERRSGYVMNAVVRSRKKSQYFLAKYMAVFLAGGVTILLPLVCSFLALACFEPAYPPEHFDTLYHAVSGHFLRDVYYAFPLAYVLYVMALDFVFAGLLAAASMALAFFLKNKFAVILLPFLFLLWVDYFQGYVWKWVFDADISPLSFLRGTGGASTCWEPILIWMIFLLAFSLGTVWRKGAKDDVL